MRQLLKVSGALPYIIVVFVNAFLDLGHKIIIQNTIFKIYDGSQQIVLTAIVNALILLPYILLVSPSGYIADKYPKSSVMKMSAWAALMLTLAITVFYYTGLFWWAFAMTFLLAVQSAFYAPAKYGYIKHLFGDELLAFGNGLVQAATIVAILSGTLIFSLLFESLYQQSMKSTATITQAVGPLGFVLVLFALIEVVFAYRLKELEQGLPGARFPWQDYRKGRLLSAQLSLLSHPKLLLLCVLGLSLFWSVGQVLLAVFPAYAKAEFEISNTVVLQAVLASSGVGIVIGSWLVGRLSRGYIETGFLPVAIVGLSCSLLYLTYSPSLLISALLLCITGIFGGLLIVPLNALLQFYAAEHQLGKVIVMNNWLQNIAMFCFLLITVVFALYDIESKLLLQLLVVMVVVIGSFMLINVPQSKARFRQPLRYWLFSIKKITGLHLLAAHQPLLLISLKSPLTINQLQIYLPGTISFHDEIQKDELNDIAANLSTLREGQVAVLNLRFLTTIDDFSSSELGAYLQEYCEKNKFQLLYCDYQLMAAQRVLSFARLSK